MKVGEDRSASIQSVFSRACDISCALTREDSGLWLYTENQLQLLSSATNSNARDAVITEFNSWCKT